MRKHALRVKFVDLPWQNCAIPEKSALWGKRVLGCKVMYATWASICFTITWKQGSTPFRLRWSSCTHHNATRQATFPRATLHLLHRYPFIPCILPCCASQRRGAWLANASSEVSCIRCGYHTSLTGFVGKIRPSYLSFRMLLYEKGILENLVDAVLAAQRKW